MTQCCRDGYVKSLSGPPIPDEAFCNLVIRSCISEASNSRNGSRYAAQHGKTFDVYEVRYTPFTRKGDDAQRCGKLSAEDIAHQHERIRKLREVAERRLPFLSFPHSIFIYDEGGRHYIASVEEFSGLSLGDIVRSGWGLIEESLFTDVLEAVEAFGKLSPLLPPHGNFSADAVKQLLTVREVTVEASQRSRWVVSDWLLSDVDDNYDTSTFVLELETMLISTFSQLQVQSDSNDYFLTPGEMEKKIKAMTSRLREYLLDKFSGSSNLCWADLKNKFPDDESHKVRKGAAQEVTSIDSLEKTRCMTVKEKIAFHQAAQRDVQQQLNRYRRRHALLPPRPNQPMIDFAKEMEVYSPKTMDSPVSAVPSAFLMLDDDDDLDSQNSFEQRMMESVSRQQVVDDIVHLAVMYEDRVRRERKEKEEEIQSKRDALRSALARSAALGATRGCHAPRGVVGSARNDASSSEFLSLSSPTISFSRVKKPESESGSPLTATNSNSRRRTLNSASRPQTARKNSNTQEKVSFTPNGVVGLLGTSIPASSPHLVSPLTEKKDQLLSVSSGSTASRGLVLGGKRKEVQLPTSNVCQNEVAVPFISPLPLNSLAAPSEGVNVPPQHSVRASPRESHNSEITPSDFPMAPQSITIGEIVPPRRTPRAQPRFHAWATRNPNTTDAAGRGQTSPKFLPKGFRRSTAADKGTRTGSTTLRRSASQGVRSFCQDLSKSEAKRKAKLKKKGETEGVTRGSIRTVTKSSVTVPKA